VRGAKWNKVDWKERTWTIPANRMKAGETHIVALSSQAIGVLQRAKAFRSPASGLIFPGQNSKLPLSDMTLLKLLQRDHDGFTVHGFRSSFRDWVAEQTEVPGEVAEAALAYTIANRVEAAYRRTNYLEKRKPLMEQWGAFCTT
jgi:integrase